MAGRPAGAIPLVGLQRPGSTRTLLSGPDGSLVRRTVLPGGLRVITEAVASVRSVALGIWVGAGSRDETPAQAGATHFLEHLLFKGTRRRTALEIASVMDAVGGELNAFTAKEHTCYYARVLDADLPLAVDVVADMLTSSLVTRADVDAERDVVLEEIAMNDDDPGDVVHDTFAEAVFGSAPLGRPILGTVDSITGMSRATVAGYYRRRYRPQDLVVTAAGNLDHAAVVRHVRRAFAGSLVDGAEPSPPRPAGGAPRARRAPAADRALRVVSRPTEQAHLVLGAAGIARTDRRRFVLGVLNGALGGGMSSRLFQEVREKRGLAYSVYSYSSHYSDAGLLGVYAGCAPAKARTVLDICRTELDRVAREGIGADELERGKGQLRGSVVLGLEDMSSRMSRLGKAELAYGELLGVDEVLRRVDAVTLDDVREVAAELLAAPDRLAVIGPFAEEDFLGAVA